jgi:hypothetical protein
MPYKPEPPPDHRPFPQPPKFSGSLSLSKKTGYSGYTGYVPSPIDFVIDGTVVVVLIDSTVLGAPIWFVLQDGWTPDQHDATAIFYASELPALRGKTVDELRSIFKVKKAFGGGMVKQ